MVCARLGAHPKAARENRGVSTHTFWEFLTLTLAVVLWCPIYANILICGDSVASLQLAMSHKSKGQNAAVGRGLAW